MASPILSRFTANNLKKSNFKPDKTLKKITMSAQDVAAIGLKAIERKKAIKVAGRFNCMMKSVVRMIPQSWTSSFMAKAQRKRGIAQ